MQIRHKNPSILLNFCQFLSRACYFQPKICFFSLNFGQNWLNFIDFGIKSHSRSLVLAEYGIIYNLALNHNEIFGFFDIWTIIYDQKITRGLKILNFFFWKMPRWAKTIFWYCLKDPLNYKEKQSDSLESFRISLFLSFLVLIFSKRQNWYINHVKYHKFRAQKSKFLRKHFWNSSSTSGITS